MVQSLPISNWHNKLYLFQNLENKSKQYFLNAKTFSFALLFFLIFTVIPLKAQNFHRLSSLPEFVIIGVDTLNFPLFNGQWNNKADTEKYGNEIIAWINNNEASYITLCSSPKSSAHISHEMIVNLEPQKRTIFKEESKLLEPILQFQKVRQSDRTDPVNGEENKLKKRINPPVTFIYLLHSNDVNRLTKKLLE